MGTITERGIICDDGEPKMSGAHSARLVNAEILHIRQVAQNLSASALDQSGLPRAYWRKRLHALTQNHQLSRTQFSEIERILEILKE